MNEILRLSYATLVVRVVHSNLMLLLDAYAEAGIVLHSVEITDELSARISIDRKYAQLLRSITEKQQGEISVLQREGVFWKLINGFHRPALVIGISILLLLSVAVSRVVLFVVVEGNSQVPEKQILHAAEQAGIRFGVLRRSVRSEQIKNRMMDMLPQLQWVGITTDGCQAIVSVREKWDDPYVDKMPLCGIFAARDGVIQSVYVTKGNALCVSGQVVKEGELLVSSYTDCGVNLRATGAEGEIYALTVREIKTVLPSQRQVQRKKTGEIQRYGLIVGKKRINFYKDSGICDTGCDKMYKEYYVTLPGGFRLPLALSIERLSYFETDTEIVMGSEAEETLRQLSDNYLCQEMVAGQILSAQTYIQQEESFLMLTGIYRCLEMIGRLQQEEIAGNYGKIG